MRCALWRIVRRPEYREDLDAIEAWITRDNPGAAIDMWTGSFGAGQGLIRQHKSANHIRQTYGVLVDEIQSGIKSGVRKINTDIRLAMTGVMRQIFAQQPGEFDPRKALVAAKNVTRGIVKARFEAFGCAGMASKIKPVALEVMRSVMFNFG